jgi:predicted nucleic acid-binding protein
VHASSDIDTWLELLTDAATVVIVPLDDEAARDAGLLAALSGHPDTHPAACHAAAVGIGRGWPVVTRRPEVIQALSGEVRTETIP